MKSTDFGCSRRDGRGGSASGWPGGLVAPGAKLGAAEANVPLKPAAWRAIGPGPAPIEAAIAAHAPSHTVYIGSFGGVLKSTDGGNTFVPASNGIEGIGATAMAM